MRLTNVHDYQVARWLLPSQSSVMSTTAIYRRKSTLERYWKWILAGAVVTVFGWIAL